MTQQSIWNENQAHLSLLPQIEPKKKVLLCKVCHVLHTETLVVTLAVTAVQCFKQRPHPFIRPKAFIPGLQGEPACQMKGLIRRVTLVEQSMYHRVLSLHDRKMKGENTGGSNCLDVSLTWWFSATFLTFGHFFPHSVCVLHLRSHWTVAPICSGQRVEVDRHTCVTPFRRYMQIRHFIVFARRIQGQRSTWLYSTAA